VPNLTLTLDEVLTTTRSVRKRLDCSITPNAVNAKASHYPFDWMKANAAKIAPLGGTAWEGGGATFIHRGVNGR
jgi:aryl sulfotransferase